MENNSWLSQVKRGLLELCILNLLDNEAMYGYQLVKHLTLIPGFVTTEGTIYPLLSRLKQEGLVVITFEESPYGPVRKKYQLSEEGKAKRKEINRMWKEVSSSVDTIAKLKK